MKKIKTSLTVSSKGIANKLISGVIVENFFTSDSVTVSGIWDTGSTGSVITKKTAQALGLISVGKRQVRGVHGIRTVDVYLATLRLEGTDIQITEQVTECDELSSDGSVGALIGMNVISTGDFAISNYRGKTKFTFRSPSQASTDYTKATTKI